LTSAPPFGFHQVPVPVEYFRPPAVRQLNTETGSLQAVFAKGAPMPTMFWIWMAAAVVFLIIELVSPTMIFICFVVGSAVAGIYAIGSPDSVLWQFGIFAGVSVVLLPFTRKLAKRISKPSPQISNVDRMIGQVALVTQAIDPDLGGKVRFEGETWVATASEPLSADTKVRIVGLSGTRVRVEKLK
jgi:inner membrane protein